MLKFCSATEPEPGSHSEEVLSGIRSLDRTSQPEEGVVLYSAFPQMLASFLISQPEIRILLKSLLCPFDKLIFTHRNTKVCSCSVPSSSSSTTTNVNFFFLKSSFVILGQKKSPILVSPSKTKIPVGVRPKLKEFEVKITVQSNKKFNVD